MVYHMQKYQKYLLGSHFRLYMNNFAPRYLINRPALRGRNFWWLFLFEEYDFKVIVKLGKANVGPDHLSIITLAEQRINP